MTLIIANIPSNLTSKVKKFIEELGGEVIPEKEVTRLLVLQELEEGFLEAKEIKEGKQEGFTLSEILGEK